MDQPGPPLVCVVVEQAGEAGFLGGNPVVDRPDARARVIAPIGERSLVLHEPLVRRLRAPAENGAQRVAHGAHVPAPDPGPFRRLDDHDPVSYTHLTLPTIYS